MITIEPCPFCGYDDVEIDETAEQGIAIGCPNCGAYGPVYPVLNGAINLWNVRAPERLRNIKAESHDVLSQALNEGESKLFLTPGETRTLGDFLYDTKNLWA